MGYYIDPAATAMLVMVTITSTCIHLFSLGYMAHDERQSRFFSFISLFTAAMLLMVIASNLLLFFMAWELMGLCSYLLIGFWYDKVYADPRQITPRQAAIKAFITTRVGDVLFMVGLAYLWTQAGSLDFGTGEGQIFNPEFLAHIGSTTNALGISVATGDCAAAVRRHGRQIGAVPAARLAAGRDGRPNARVGADPRRHDGRGRRVPGRRASTRSSWPAARCRWWPSSARSPRCSRR